MPSQSGPILDSGAIANVRDFFENYPLAWDPDYVRLFDDFDRIVIDSATASKWTVVKDATASVAIEADTLGGRALLSSAATTENDGASIQGNEIFKLAAGQDIWFEAKVQIATVAQIDFFVGLCENFAANPEAILTAAERIGFQIDDGDASILLKTEADTVETSTDSEVDAVDAADIVLGFHITGISKVEFFINRLLVGTHTTNLNSDENMTVGIGHISGQATGTQTVALDYIMCTQKR